MKVRLFTCKEERLDFHTSVLFKKTFLMIPGCLFKHQTVTDQATKCDGSVDGDVFTCENPVISYGSVDGGIPTNHGGNDYTKWCNEMGFDGYVGTVQTKQETVSSPNGGLFGCSSYDDSNWHWCDNSDGNWLNQALNSQGSKTRVTQVKCKLKNNQVLACLSGK